ncbi:hypothetical protein V8F33_012253 [Rhypophila sp. PSN 637]
MMHSKNLTELVRPDLSPSQPSVNDVEKLLRLLSFVQWARAGAVPRPGVLFWVFSIQASHQTQGKGEMTASQEAKKQNLGKPVSQQPPPTRLYVTAQASNDRGKRRGGQRARGWQANFSSMQWSGLQTQPSPPPSRTVRHPSKIQPPCLGLSTGTAAAFIHSLMEMTAQSLFSIKRTTERRDDGDLDLIAFRGISSRPKHGDGKPPHRGPYPPGSARRGLLAISAPAHIPFFILVKQWRQAGLND